LTAKEKQIGEGALEHAMETRFVAVQERQLRRRCERAEGSGETLGFIARGLCTQAVVEQSGFDHDAAAHAPTASDQVFDHGVFDTIARADAAKVLGQQEVEDFPGFIRKENIGGQQSMAKRVL